MGDALGLPWEGLAASWIPQELPPTPLSGRISDDTEQTVLVAEALLAGADEQAFRTALARGLLRWWLALPTGIGLGTLRAGFKLLVGVPPDRSGVSSAGNGAAMRAALLGLVVPDERLDSWVEAASHVTHRDERAVDGARVVAVAARIGARAGLAGRRAHMYELLPAARTDELREALREVFQAVEQQAEPVAFAAALGVEGFVSGYVLHTVPVAVFLWLRHDDPAEAMRAAVRMGGDTDTVAAIVGALHGATVGASGLPQHWPLRDAPVSRERLEGLATSLGQLTRGEPVTAPVPVGWSQWLVRSLRVLPVELGWVVARRLRAR